MSLRKPVADHSPAVPQDPGRRLLLTGLVAGYATSFIPAALAAPEADASRDAFLAVSKILTGRDRLDPAQASRLYEALVADDPAFAQGVQALATTMQQRKIELSQLQHLLDTEQSPLAALPRRIATGWFVGVVGEGERARCVTYETSLMNVIVSDRLRPPSYCYGVYGSWSEKPA